MVEHKTASKDSKKGSHFNHASLHYAIVALILVFGVVSWVALSAQHDAKAHRRSYDSLMSDSKFLLLRSDMHRTAAASHRTSMMEEAVEDAPQREVQIKRLALSIALAKNGTGFEDRFVERVMQNASDEELNGLRNSFLTSLFDNYPPALRHQEGVQMQMDALMEELKNAGLMKLQSQGKEQDALRELKESDSYSSKALWAWRCAILVLMVIALGKLWHFNQVESHI